MKWFAPVAAIGAFLIGTSAPLALAAPDGRSKIWFADGVESEGIIVKYRPGSTVDLPRDLGLTVQRQLANNRVLVGTQPERLSGGELRRLMVELAADPDVELVEPNVVIPAPDPTAATNDTAQEPVPWNLQMISAPGAWDSGASGDGITVAVIDTGITDHPDLTDQTVAGYDFLTDVTRANDGDGRDADAHDAGDWMERGACGNAPDGSPIPPRDIPSSWHGTHVAGIVAMVAPKSRLLPVRILGRCGGVSADTADAIVWAAGGAVPDVPPNATPARVLNMSFGDRSMCPPAIRDALQTAHQYGAVSIAAAGNDNADAANYWLTNCAAPRMSVAALDRSGSRAAYSNYGMSVDIAAPGSEIMSTYNSGKTHPAEPTHAELSGTSMAAPHVAGVAALVFGVANGLGPKDVDATLRQTARPIPGTGCAIFVQACGRGLVDAAAAVGASASPQ
ncbi:S8 family serine peptidase [Allorhizocola rhizosphaerae]|uniref:S8 family serine peptidase n=1 Tax=Allorhizocola rhizosphaerae TaxID=1872709 RepID=UPI0013C35A4A|nr:S8 family serine peptidase [Allorhizocola rhizosphaerae]